MQAKKSIEKMNALIKMRKAKNQPDVPETNMEMEHPPMTPDERLIERALDIPLTDLSNLTYIDLDTLQDESAYLSVLREQFPKLDNGSITSEGFTQLMIAITAIQVIKNKVVLPMIEEIKEVEVEIEKHYEEHSSNAIVHVIPKEDTVLHPTKKKSYGFFDVVYEAMMPPRYLFGLKR